MAQPPHVQVTITPGTILTAVLVVLGVGLVFLLHELLLVVLTAVVLASAIEPATSRLMRFGVPRILSVVTIYLFIALMMVLFFSLFVPPLLHEANSFLANLPTYMETMNVGVEDLTFTGAEGASITSQLLQFREMLSSSTSLFAAAESVFGGIISFALIVVLSFYFAAQERGLDDFLRLITPVKNQEYILNLWKRSQVKMGRWLQGQLMLSAIVGIFVFIGLAFLDVRYALLLAIVAALFELIPVFGSILAAVPAVAIGLIDGGPTAALLIVVLYTVINQVQGNIIYPKVVQKLVGVPPLVVILAIIAGAQLGGFLGILIAVPIAAAVQEYVTDVQKAKNRTKEPELPLI